MKKKVKRKYTKKIATEPVSDSVKEESSTILQPGKVDTPVSEFSFNDLPLSIQTYVNGIIKNRKARGLPDDSKEQKERAIKYFRGDRPR